MKQLIYIRSLLHSDIKTRFTVTLGKWNEYWNVMVFQYIIEKKGTMKLKHFEKNKRMRLKQRSGLLMKKNRIVWFFVSLPNHEIKSKQNVKLAPTAKLNPREILFA